MANNKREPETNFFRITHEHLETTKFKALKPSSKILYMYLCKLRNRFANSDGVFFRSDVQLSEDAGLSPPSIWKARHELLRAGFIKWEQGSAHKACRYQIFDFN